MEHATSSDLSAGERGGSAVQTAIAGALVEGALFLAPILVVVALWQAATMWLETPGYLLPSPVAVGQAAWTSSSSAPEVLPKSSDSSMNMKRGNTTSY